MADRDETLGTLLTGAMGGLALGAVLYSIFAPVDPAPAGAEPAAHLRVVKAEEARAVVSAGGPVFVELTASWCGWCRKFAPEAAAVAAQRPSVSFMAVDVDATPMRIENTRGVPSFGIYSGGRLAASFSGYMDRRSLSAWLDKNLAKP